MEDVKAADGVTVVGEVVDLPVAHELGLAKPREFLNFLRDQGMVTGTEPRKVSGLASSVQGVLPLPDRSVRCFILTPEGKRRLAARSAGRSTTTP